MDDQGLLDRLVGNWRITGTMGDSALAQSVTARRVLHGKFIELRVADGTPLIDGKPYEAVYYICATGEGQFVLVLLDVFGVSGAPVPGLGHRDGDSLVFEFDYGSGPWTWRWRPIHGGWELEQTYLDAGQRRTFATKRMRRAG